MVIIAECITLIKEVMPHITNRSNKLKQLIELQTQPCVSSDEKLYLDEAIASLVFLQYTGIKTNAKNRKTLYEYQQKTGITWEELELCYTRLLTAEGQIRRPIRKDFNRLKLISFFMISIPLLICGLLWHFSGYGNLTIQISILIIQLILAIFTLKVCDLALDISMALKTIDKLHDQSKQPLLQVENISKPTATA